MTARRRVRVRGAVQGVGFRPFVYRLAVEAGLSGWVLNDADGVLLELEGDPGVLDGMLDRLRAELPIHARIESLESHETEPTGARGFEIRPSPPGSRGAAELLPDLATCPACLAEVRDPTDRRYRYPFTNCTHCGPRFSIVERLPYDRANTTMDRFAMCSACRAEYDDPRDRRFHAQPNACPDCGPQLQLDQHSGDDAMRTAAALLRDGAIVAVKGIGGFHLMVDARDTSAVERLRARKGRRDKPFAVMFPNAAAVDQACHLTEVERAALTASDAPIVLVRARPGVLPDAVAPRNPLVGAVLPYTPLHHLLLADLGFPVVATSANLAGEPICTDLAAAERLLGSVADAFLDHDRPIRRPVEDSVVRQFKDDVVVLRRGRGLAPSPVAPCPVDGILGRGAQQRVALAVSHGGHVIAGPHLGDLSDDLAALDAYATAVSDFTELFAIDRAVVDAHPDYVSRRDARAAAQVQHHHAHAAACLAEHGLDRALAVVWDGTGYGSDGTIWGGEFLDATRADFTRVAHLRGFRLPGGEAAIRHPARQALALCWELGLDLPDFPHAADLCAMLRTGLNAPVTTAAGRLFDAVSWILGLGPDPITFDGEAAIALEHAASETDAQLPPLRLVRAASDGGGSGPASTLDWGPTLVALRASTASPSALAAAFHVALARGIAEVAATVDVPHVVLTGGCFQNRRLLEATVAELRAIGRTPIWPRRIPPNDGGVAVGQVIVAASRPPNA